VREASDRAASDKARQIEEKMREETVRVEALQEEGSRLQAEIDERRAQLSRQVNEFDSSITQRLTEIAARPQAFFAENVILRAALSLGDGRQQSAAPARLGPPVFVLDPSVPALNEPKAVRHTLLELGSRMGLGPAIPRRLHVSLLSGAMPVVNGAESIEVLQGYASCICAGRLLWLPVSPSYLDPADLLGRLDRFTGRFVPQSGRLLDLLIEAQETDELYLVVLDGVNRAAVDTYLVPILESYGPSDTSPPKLPLVHPSAVNLADPYVSTPFLAWPANVLLAGTIIESPAAVPLGPMLWDHATLIDLDAAEGYAPNDAGGASAGAHRTKRPINRITFSKWKEWQQSVTEASERDDGREMEAFVTSESRIRRKTRMLLRRILATSRLCLTDGTRSATDVITTCVVPHAVVRPDAVQPDLSHLEPGQRQEVEAYMASAKRILGSTETVP
jgi:hypothetical protein